MVHQIAKEIVFFCRIFSVLIVERLKMKKEFDKCWDRKIWGQNEFVNVVLKGSGCFFYRILQSSVILDTWN